MENQKLLAKFQMDWLRQLENALASLFRNLSELLKPDWLKHRYKNNLQSLFDLKESVRDTLDQIIDSSKIALILDQESSSEPSSSQLDQLDEALEKPVN